MFSIIIFLTTYFFSLYLAPFHIYGDQEHYTEAYNAIKGLSFLDAWISYTSIIYTGEPVHFTIIWLSSSLGLEKNLVMGLSNSLLAVLFTRYLYKKNFSLILTFFILVTNYYLLTMFFTLERTKFAFILFFIALLNKRKIVFLISIFTHSIMLFPIFAYLTSKYINTITLLKKGLVQKNNKLKNKIKLLGFILICVFVYFYLGEHLINKFNSYAFIDFEIYQIIIISFFSYITATSKSEALIFFLIIIISILVLGGDRLNMLGYFAFLHFGNIKNPLFKNITLLLIIYYSIKSMVYINMIITTGG